MLDFPRSNKFVQVYVGFQGAECFSSSSTRHEITRFANKGKLICHFINMHNDILYVKVRKSFGNYHASN